MKKKHFYSGRIRTLSIALSILTLGLISTGFIGTPIKEIPEQLTKGIKSMSIQGGIATAFLAPLALVQKLKDGGNWDKLDENQQKFMTSLEKEINDAFEKQSKGLLTEEQVKKKYDEWIKEHGKGLSDEQLQQFKDMAQSVKDQATLIQQLKDNGIGGEVKVGAITKALKDNADKIKSFKANKSGKLTIEVKAGGADQAATDIATHTIGTRVPGIGQIPVRKPFMRDLFPVVNCNTEFIRYMDQESVVRDAKNVASAAVSTHTTKLTWKERNIQITAVRDLIDIPIDMLDDYDFVEGELRNLIDSSVALKIDNGLLKGTGVNPELHSVNEVASEFDHANAIGVWTGKVDDPNFFDLAIAMTSQIIALGQDGSYMPNTILVNTIDKYRSMLIKDDNGQYLLPPFVVRSNNKEYTVDGMVVRSNPNVDTNTMFVFDSTKGTLYQRKGIVIEMSFENATNFETEVVTLKGYERLNLLIRNLNANAFMKCTDVTAALAAISKP
ncbi:MAG TPA: phage major capsid protein [Chitinophagaceae bacterium]